MKLFGSNTDNEYRPFFSTVRANIGNRYIVCRNISKKVKVPRDIVESVTIEPKSFTKSKLKFIGKGSVLGEIELTNFDAEKLQNWLLDRIYKN